MQKEVNGYWPAYFPQRKLTRDEGMILEKAFWEMIFKTKDCIEVYKFLKTYFRTCFVINNYGPVRPWFDDPDEEEQWGCEYRDDMISQLERDLYKKNFSVQYQVKDDEIHTLENRNKLWLNIISNAQGSVPDNLFDYDYSDEGLDNSVCGARIFPEIAEFKEFLVILRCK